MWQEDIPSVSRTPPAVTGGPTGKAGEGMQELLGAKRAFTDRLQGNGDLSPTSARN